MSGEPRSLAYKSGLKGGYYQFVPPTRRSKAKPLNAKLSRDIWDLRYAAEEEEDEEEEEEVTRSHPAERAGNGVKDDTNATPEQIKWSLFPNVSPLIPAVSCPVIQIAGGGIAFQNNCWLSDS